MHASDLQRRRRARYESDRFDRPRIDNVRRQTQVDNATLQRFFCYLVGEFDRGNGAKPRIVDAGR